MFLMIPHGSMRRGYSCFRLQVMRRISIYKNLSTNTFLKISTKTVKNCDIKLPGINNSLFHSSPLIYTKRIIPYILSDIGEGIVEVAVKEWLVKPGDKVAQFDAICEVQSDKASVTITSRYDGIVNKLHYEVDAIAKVGTALLDIETAVDSSDQNTESTLKMSNIEVSEETKSRNEEEFFKNKTLATPAVRRIAKENNVVLSRVRGSGKNGRIMKEDVLPLVTRGQVHSKQGEALPQQSSCLNRVEPIRGFRKAMAKSMSNAWTVPHFSYCDEVDAGALVGFKPQMKVLGKRENVKITYMPLFIKAASLALEKFPILNSTVDENCENVTYMSAHNIGVAMDTPRGLVVPNVKNVEKKSVVDVARELNRLQSAGAQSQLSLVDLSEGSFTLSNIGSIGGTYAKPIIFTPQVAIGALGQIQVLPRFDDKGNIVAAHIFNISWCADHRVVDGATLAKFSNLWKLYVQHPRLLLHL